MALADDNRTSVEQRLRDAIVTGQPVDLRTGNPEDDDPAHGDGWDARRSVAAALLIDLLTSPGSSGRPRALRLAGARIIGVLDLEAATLTCPLLLRDCSMEQQVNLAEAEASCQPGRSREKTRVGTAARIAAIRARVHPKVLIPAAVGLRLRSASRLAGRR